MVRKHLELIKSNPLYPAVLGFLGGVVYLVQSWYYAHTQISVLDEGAYLLKGYLFAMGKYWPFQDYGPWTNHMPLSFLIPGWVERIFGPGLRTGRYFAVFLGALTLVGLWLISRRFGNLWWSALLIWLLALNIPVIKVYSVMTSQGLVTCMLVWILFLTLGPDRPTWQVYLGVVLAGLLLLTRINMAPILPLLLLYIFWEHGKKIGVRSGVLFILVVGIGHAVFWPGILKLWAAWLPKALVPFISAWAKPIGAVPSWNPAINFQSRLMSFLLGFRIHFFALMGMMVSLLIWPPKRNWRAAWRFKIAVFFIVSYTLLFGFHAWASLGKDYCVFCFQNYLMFFLILGILQANLLFTSLDEYKVRAGKLLSFLVVLSGTTGIAYSLIKGNYLIGTWSGRVLVNTLTNFWNMNVSRFRSGTIVPGKIELWGLFANKFGWQKDQILDASVFACFILLSLLSWLLLTLCLAVYKNRRTGSKSSSFNLGYLGLITFWILGTVYTYRLGFFLAEYDCGWDVIASYERAGSHLAEMLPPGSTIYWNGGLSVAPLLYLSNYEIYPPQINNRYSFRLEGDTEELLRYGWWNDDLNKQWFQDADIILIEGWRVENEGKFFDELTPTPPLLPCKRNTEIHIYIRE